MFAPSNDPVPGEALANEGSSDGRRVLGIDPGLTRCGYAVLESSGTHSARAVSIGVLTSESSEPTSIRLGRLHSDIEDLFDDFRPSVLAVEQVFFQANARTAMSVAQVSGIAMALATRRGVPVVEYTPNQVKESVTGWGGADKLQVQKMVQSRLGLSRLPEPPDAADAAAVALCFLSNDPLRSRLEAAGVPTLHGRVRAR